MFDRTIQTSEAPRATPEGDAKRVIPALCGCEECGTQQLIAAPSIGSCAECGAELRVLPSRVASRSPGQEPETWSPYAA